MAAEQPKPIKDQIIAMFLKIAAKTITREEGALFLNDLARRDKGDDVRLVILDLCLKPPKDVYEKTMIHTVALAKNPIFGKILEVALEHKVEDVCIVAAEGLARLGNEEAKNALVRRLDSDIYHVRKASAEVLIKGWGKEGIKLVSIQGLSHPETYYRYTSALALARSGNMGMATLLEIMKSNDVNRIQSAAEALLEVKDAIKRREDILGFVHALEVAVSVKHPNAAIALLKLLGAMREKAAGFEEYIAVLLDYNFEPIRIEAKNALASIATERASQLISPLEAHRVEDVQHSYYLANEAEDGWTR